MRSTRAARFIRLLNRFCFLLILYLKDKRLYGLLGFSVLFSPNFFHLLQPPSALNASNSRLRFHSLSLLHKLNEFFEFVFLRGFTLFLLKEVFRFPGFQGLWGKMLFAAFPNRWAILLSFPPEY